MSQEDIDGYTVSYDREEIQFPVYVVIIIGITLLAAALANASLIILACALAAFAIAYYNVPLLETGRPRIGASQYGMLIEGLGIIPWRTTKSIELVPIEMRGEVSNELHITLNRPIPDALIADWRKRPWHRIGMRLPWSKTKSGIIRIPLDKLDRPVDEIFQAFTRMHKFYGV